MYQIYFILQWHSTCFGRFFHPLSGVQDCTYSNRHLSNRYCCLLAIYNETNKVHQCIRLILFWNDNLHVSDGLSPHHQEFKTVHPASGICQTYCRLLASNQTAVSVWQMPVVLCTVLNSWWWTERPYETCNSKINKFDTLVHLVGVTVGIKHTKFCRHFHY